MPVFNKIFNQSIGKFYLFSSAFGIILGLVIATLCIDIFDKLSNSVLKSSDQSHLIVNKKVGLMNMLSLSDNSFTEAEIEELKEQEFIDDVGEIISSTCRIWAFRDTEPLKFKTDIFFEALDDKFLDKIPYEWHWREDDDFVPVMINADFLNLYNFAFAKTQNLPQFTKGTVGQLTVFLEINGQGKKKLMKTRIVEVSDRIPSIVVPKKFLTYVNDNFGKPNDGKYSRLMLKVTNPSDPKLIDFLEQRDIIANEDILSSGTSKIVLAQVLAGEMSLAFVILLLACILVIISFELLISNSRKDIELLKILGFHSKELSEYFLKKFIFLSAIQIVISLSICCFIGYKTKKYIENAGYQEVSILSLNALLLFVLVSSMYYFFFNWRINKILKA